MITKKDRYKIRPAAYLVLEKGGKIFLMRRSNTGYEDGKYGLPSGHLEKGELPDECIIRETEEEVGVKVERSDLQFMNVVYNTLGDQGDYVDFFFKTNTWIGEPQILEKDKCDDINWFEWHDLPDNLVPEVRAGLEGYLKKISYQIV